MDRYYKINEILLNCDRYLQRISDTKFKMAAVCRLENEASCLRERERAAFLQQQKIVINANIDRSVI
jgi:hypothetical protein